MTKTPNINYTKAAAFLDKLRADFNLKNDAELAKRIGVAPPTVSKLRNGLNTVGPAFILAVHEGLGVPVSAIREAV